MKISISYKQIAQKAIIMFTPNKESKDSSIQKYITKKKINNIGTSLYQRIGGGKCTFNQSLIITELSVILQIQFKVKKQS